MQELKIEDTILLVDTSRSMMRKDITPNRLAVALYAVKNFIQTKFAIDPKDRISIISFGDVPKRLSPFSYDENKLFSSLKKIQISGKGSLHQAIALSLQVIIQEMRKIGGKIQRIFIISDDKLAINQTKLDKIVNIAKGLGVYIDVCQLGKPQERNKNLLKRMAQITNGEYGYFNNSRAIITAGGEFASKKEIKTQAEFYYTEKKEKSAPLVGEIALSLRRPTLMEIRMMMTKKSEGEDKCAICHSIKAPLTRADFYAEGRYCPNCERPVHLSCAAMWAKGSEFKENIFRCPFCFFLLKLPKSAVKMVKNIDADSQKIKIIEDIDIKESKMIEIHEDNISQINASCSYCHNIFLGDFKVFKCENCGSYYHEPCLKKMFTELKACRFCGAKIILN
ncbi:MAG: VWA domain-containing protein [Candidatus Thorarchaeota archaeon]